MGYAVFNLILGIAGYHDRKEFQDVICGNIETHPRHLGSTSHVTNTLLNTFSKWVESEQFY